METRTCTKCGKDKPLDAFAKQRLGKFGRRASCLECGKKSNRAAYVATHPNAKLGVSPKHGMTASERQALYEKRHPEVKTLKHRRARETLARNYVRGLLADSFGVPRNFITDEIVKLKTAQLSVMRQTNQLVKTIKEKQNERD